MSEEILREARRIGDILKERHNVQPAAIPELDNDGIMRVPYTPPPSLFDVKLSDLGKQTQVY